MLDPDLQIAKRRRNARTDVLTKFAARGPHINTLGDIVIPSPSPNAQRTQDCKKYGFRFSDGVYPQWYRSPKARYLGREWSSQQWLDLAGKIVDAAE